jgi:hypothetical protein
MCDPVTAGILLASTAASVGGGVLSQSEAQSSAANEAAARNRVLEQYMERQRNLHAQNQEQAAKARGELDETKQTAKQAENVEQRSQAIDTNAQPADAGAIPLSGNAPSIVKSQIAQRMLSAFTDATDEAKAKGKFSAYGDTWGQNDRAMLQPGRMIDTFNNFSRANTSMLPLEQDLVGYANRKPPSGLGPLLQGLGSIGGMAAGGMNPAVFGAPKALGHAVSTAAPAAPWWGASTAFPWG